MSEKDINNLKEMLVDFNEYSTDYTKTRCRELEETIENTLKEIERLNNERENDIKYNKYLQKELAKSNNIIKEVREYIKSIDNYFLSDSCMKIIETLNKGE